MDEYDSDLSKVWNPLNAEWNSKNDKLTLAIEHGYAMVVIIEGDRPTFNEDIAVLHPRNALKLLAWLLAHQCELELLAQEGEAYGVPIQYPCCIESD